MHRKIKMPASLNKWSLHFPLDCIQNLSMPLFYLSVRKQHSGKIKGSDNWRFPFLMMPVHQSKCPVNNDHIVACLYDGMHPLKRNTFKLQVATWIFLKDRNLMIKSTVEIQSKNIIYIYIYMPYGYICLIKCAWKWWW